MYWAPGAGHGPHHIFKEWADKYKGQFDDGWDALRERIFARQKELRLAPRRHQAHAAGREPWRRGTSIPECGAALPAPADGGIRGFRRTRAMPRRAS